MMKNPFYVLRKLPIEVHGRRKLTIEVHGRCGQSRKMGSLAEIRVDSRRRCSELNSVWADRAAGMCSILTQLHVGTIRS